MKRTAADRPGQSQHMRKYGPMYFQPKTSAQSESFWMGKPREAFAAVCAAESMRMRGSKEYFMRYGQIVWE